MIRGGYQQRLLRVDLTHQTYRVEELSEEILRTFFGGRMLGGKLMWDEVPPDADPLGSENRIYILTGAYNGTPSPSASRYCIVTKSPETGLYNDSYGGGHFGPEIKFAGYDVLAFEGMSEKPVTVFIQDDQVTFLDASHLWGHGAWYTEETLERELGHGTRILTIGVAGENLSNLAIVQNEYYHEAGRGGIGAVFGAKKLKAVAVRGTKGVRVAEPERLIDYIRVVLEPKYSMVGGFGAASDRMKYGTTMTLNVTNKVGILPTRNYKYGQYDKYDHIDGNAARNEIIESDKGCYGCNFGCVKYSRAKKGSPYEGAVIGGPEYETDALHGANLDIPDMSFIVKSNGICDDLGIDVIGAGVLVGFAMECYELGILTKEDFGGLEMNFGNQASALKLMEMIAYRQGIGDLLTQGVKIASETIGKGSEHIAMHVKGLEFPAYRACVNAPGFGLIYTMTDRGACHRRAWTAIAEQTMKPFCTEGRAALVKKLYDQRTPWHVGVSCDLGVLNASFTHEDAANMYTYIIGWNVTEAELQLLCDRTATFLRALNIRMGLKREDEILPGRCYDVEPAGKGAGHRLTKEMIDTMQQEYFELRNWDVNGVPKREWLIRLGFKEQADALEAIGAYHEE